MISTSKSSLLRLGFAIIAIVLTTMTYQNCARVQFNKNLTESTLSSINACDPKAGSPTAMRACSDSNQHGTGYQTCNTDGLGYSTGCSITACSDLINYYPVPVANTNPQQVSCQAVQCLANNIYPCTDSAGRSGNAVCNKYGTGLSACVATTCDQGFVLQAGVCIPNGACTPGVSYACSVANGTGSRVCKADRTLPTACSNIICDSGYKNINGVCKQIICDAANPTIINSTLCMAIPYATSTTQTCDSTGTSISGCQVNSCSTNYSPSPDKTKCVQTGCANGAINPQDPDPANVCKTCASNLELYPNNATGKCVATCSAGFIRKSDGSCGCNPGELGPASHICLANGTGDSRCNAQGNGFACVYTSCAPGFTLSVDRTSCQSCNNALPVGGIWGANCSYTCDASKGLIKDASGNCVVANPTCSAGQYPINTTCAGICNNKPQNASYTTPGQGLNPATGLTDCGWQCDSGYYQVGNACSARYAWSPGTPVKSPSGPTECGTMVTTTTPYVCKDLSNNSEVAESICTSALGPRNPAQTTALDTVSCYCPAGFKANSQMTACTCDGTLQAAASLKPGVACPSGYSPGTYTQTYATTCTANGPPWSGGWVQTNLVSDPYATACTKLQPVDCVGSWGACSVTCGTGTQTYSVSQQPANGGRACEGPTTTCNATTPRCDACIAKGGTPTADGNYCTFGTVGDTWALVRMMGAQREFADIGGDYSNAVNYVCTSKQGLLVRHTDVSKTTGPCDDKYGFATYRFFRGQWWFGARDGVGCGETWPVVDTITCQF